MSYTFANAAPEAVQQLGSLEWFLDPVTTRQLEALNLPAGARCWEIGAGGGSIAGWLAEHVGPTGHVDATDIAIDRLDQLATSPNVTVQRHDVTSLVPPTEGRPYDLIHARLVLLHLPTRAQVLTALVSCLAPGGWLLLEEFDCTAPLRVYTSRSAVDTELFHRVTGAIIDILTANGADMAWAHAVLPAMRAAGLVEVSAEVHSRTVSGGDPGARLHDANSRQLAVQLDALGVTPGELDRFRGIVADPAHTAASYVLVSTRGRRAPNRRS